MIYHRILHIQPNYKHDKVESYQKKLIKKNIYYQSYHNKTMSWQVFTLSFGTTDTFKHFFHH